MNRFKETYLAFLIVISLVSLAIYSTYAMFNMELNTNNIVSINTTISLDTNLNEYEMFTINSYDTKQIELKVSNSKEESLYYGIWYEIISGTEYNLEGYVITTSPSKSVDIINIKEEKSISLAFINNTNRKATIKLGIITSQQTSLNLSENRKLIINELDISDIKTNTISEQIISNYSQDSNELYYNNENLLYYGENPNNYVIFNNLLWRIIGVYNGKVKIISNDSIGNYIYDTEMTSWGSSQLNLLLNNLYYESKSGTCYKNNEVGNCDFTNTGLNTISKNQIEKFEYDLESISLKEINNIFETKINKLDKASSNITILSLTDYINSFNCQEETCLTNNSWLTTNNELLLATNTISEDIETTYNIFIDEDSNLNINGENIKEYLIKPVVQLKKEIYIVSGEGTRENPYILK